MRTTVDLPEAVFRLAQEQATQRGVEVNQFIAAAIVKEVSTATPVKAMPPEPRTRSRLPAIKGKGTGTIPDVTPALQARVQEEEDLASYQRSFGR